MPRSSASCSGPVDASSPSSASARCSPPPSRLDSAGGVSSSSRISAAWRTCQSWSARHRSQRLVDLGPGEGGQGHRGPSAHRRLVARARRARRPALPGRRSSPGRPPPPRGTGCRRAMAATGARSPTAPARPSLAERPQAASTTSGSGSRQRRAQGVGQGGDGSRGRRPPGGRLAARRRTTGVSSRPAITSPVEHAHPGQGAERGSPDRRIGVGQAGSRGRLVPRWPAITTVVPSGPLPGTGRPPMGSVPWQDRSAPPRVCPSTWPPPPHRRPRPRRRAGGPSRSAGGPGASVVTVAGRAGPGAWPAASTSTTTSSPRGRPSRWRRWSRCRRPGPPHRRADPPHRRLRHPGEPARLPARPADGDAQIVTSTELLGPYTPPDQLTTQGYLEMAQAQSAAKAAALSPSRLPGARARRRHPGLRRGPGGPPASTVLKVGQIVDGRGRDPDPERVRLRGRPRTPTARARPSGCRSSSPR